MIPAAATIIEHKTMLRLLNLSQGDKYVTIPKTTGTITRTARRMLKLVISIFFISPKVKSINPETGFYKQQISIIY
jgi:hypothetical protein